MEILLGLKIYFKERHDVENKNQDIREHCHPCDELWSSNLVNNEDTDPKTLRPKTPC